eukprot:752236-Hanusia_phi.AAC.4
MDSERKESGRRKPHSTAWQFVSWTNAGERTSYKKEKSRKPWFFGKRHSRTFTIMMLFGLLIVLTPFRLMLMYPSKARVQRVLQPALVRSCFHALRWELTLLKSFSADVWNNRRKIQQGQEQEDRLLPSACQVLQGDVQQTWVVSAQGAQVCRASSAANKSHRRVTMLLVAYRRYLDASDGWQCRAHAVSPWSEVAPLLPLSSLFLPPPTLLALPPPPTLSLLLPDALPPSLSIGEELDNKAYFFQAVSEYAERNGCKYFQVTAASACSSHSRQFTPPTFDLGEPSGCFTFFYDNARFANSPQSLWSLKQSKGSAG